MMRNSTALTLTVPPFAEIVIWIFRPNVFVLLLAPLMFLALVMLISALAVASKHHERTSRTTWTLLGLAGVAQLATLIGLGAFR